MIDENWVDEVLRKASDTVRAWPEWMLRAEVRFPERPSEPPPRGEKGRPMSASHKCHAHGCSREIPPRFLFCAPHWHATRKTLQNAILNEYRMGQEQRKDPSARYLAIQRLCVSELAYRKQGGVAPSVGIAHAYGEQAEVFRQKAIREGHGDPFEQLSRRPRVSKSQLELPGLGAQVGAPGFRSQVSGLSPEGAERAKSK